MIDKLIEQKTSKLAKAKKFNFTYNDFYLPELGLCHFGIDGEWVHSKNKSYYDCNGLFNELKMSKATPAPSQTVLMKWLREKHKIDILINRSFTEKGKLYVMTACYDKPLGKNGYKKARGLNYSDVLEQALLNGLNLIT